MGRYPFLAMIPRYLRDHSAVLCPETRELRRQRLERIGRRMEQLKQQNQIKTTNPAKLTRSDALAIVSDMSARGWKPTYLEEMITVLRHFVTYAGNPVFEQLGRLKLLPKAPPPSIKVLSEEELGRIHRAAEQMSGWEGEVAKFICSMYVATGLRASELRLARMQDLDTTTWEIRVVNPKGKGRYASERVAPVHPRARSAILRFVSARQIRLQSAGVTEAEPLIPRILDGEVGYYSVPGLRNIKRRVEQMAGVRFKIKDFRSTFAQRTIDIDPSLLSAVSKALGHRTTMTTESYYARIGDAPAIRELQKAWQQAEVSRPQSALIDRKALITGYS